MIVQLENKKPMISDKAYIAENASVIGDVSIDEGCGIWFGAVIRADTGSIRIGKNSNVQDNCVLHADPGGAVVLGDNDTIGHCAVLHGCRIGDNVLVGMSATILNGAEISNDSIVGACSLVTQGKKFPGRSLILGSPAKAVRELSDEEVRSIRSSAEEYCALRRKYAPLLG